MSFDVMDYGQDFQQLLIDVIMSDADIFVRCQNIIKVEYFQNKQAKAVQYIIDYAQKYSTLPTVEEVNLKSGTKCTLIPTIDASHQQGFLDTIEEFCRHKALENAIINGMELVKKRQYGKVEELVKEAMLVSLQRDLGTNYFLDPEERNTRLFSAQGTISTGWKDVDYKLYGGYGLAELEIYVAPSGGGKSVVLQNSALNFSKKHMNGIYITLELKEELVAQRMDSILTGRTKQEMISDLSTSSAEVQVLGKNMAPIYIKRMPESITTVHDIKAYIREVQIKTGLKLHYLVVDYLDLLNSPRCDPSDMFIKDKFVCEELRALANELDITVVTASQLNRSAVEADEYNHSNIAGGISKIYTADNVIGIFNTQVLRDRGEIQFQFLKTRNSNGVGSKIRLSYNIDTLCISDYVDPTGLNNNSNVQSTSSILNAVTSGKNTVVPPQTQSAPIQNSAASQLKNLIKKTR